MFEKSDRVDRQRIRRLIKSVRKEAAVPVDDPRGRELQRLATIDADTIEKMLAEHLEGGKCDR